MLKRNLNLDVLRLIGVLIIMIAHSSPPDWLFQLRNFGTPLLIVSSAMTYAVIYSKKNIDMLSFLKKRLTRLTIPIWIFLTFFFSVILVITKIIGIPYVFSQEKIIQSYLLIDGIGFVWIFKVYIILALITPLVVVINKKVASENVYYLGVFLSYVIYEFLVYVISPNIEGAMKLVFDNVIFIVIPYSLLYFYGYRLRNMGELKQKILTFLYLIVFSFMACQKYFEFGHFVPTQLYKYPPTIYYLSYALLAIHVVYFIFKDLELSNMKCVPLVVWMSSNSLWIYLWHIMAFYIWKGFWDLPNGDVVKFLMMAAFLLSFGVIVTKLQLCVVKFVTEKNNPAINKLMIYLS
jgi:peptidoglycan/LPS O-acetylase OafA/YrhL